MEKFNIFSHIAERTAGSIYVGVVGPVRTGKSTFIKRFMDLFVMPNISDIYLKERTRDELPQSGAGRTITTTEPKFVPDEPVEITFGENTRAKIRLVDCVGYTVAGAKGYMDEDGPRLVRTPWFEHPIPFQEAAELGTRRVITEHSTIGLVVSTDGSIADLPRSEYEEPEARVVEELQALGKPFVVALNSIHPNSPETLALAERLRDLYEVTVVPMDCLRMTQDDILRLFTEVLMEFPLREFNVRLPKWVQELKKDHWLRQIYEDLAWETVMRLKRVKDVQEFAVQRFHESEHVQVVNVESLDLSTGKVTLSVVLQNQLFYDILAELTGLEVEGDHHLMRLMQDLTAAKREYDKISAALQHVRETGYGIVIPSLDDITFEQPELIKQGRNFGIKLTASAPSIHMVQASIQTEVTPFVGTEKQGEELIRSLTEEFERDPNVLWERDFLGRSLQDMVREGINSKLYRMPEHAQEKLQETLSKIINEGSGGLICIIL
ncbi:MAG: stage IV sporulation protein A [Limnochordia bacterium]|jgi:stage IV sporulation protein A|nr:stage IV sporulation protein A [Bacillota bacterium]NLL08108.1 stage IV sporulation protein A [Bacillota bacterium]HBG08771.1 stage IV sporulation protein A [Bacillota bacterium]